MRINGLIRTLIASIALSGAGLAGAAEAPSRDAANAVADYFFSGAKRPVLMALKVCESIHEDGDEKHNCRNEIPEGELKEGQSAYLWMKFLVPKGAEPRILMQVSHKGITRDTFDRQISGALRYRTWNKVTFSRAGDWAMQLFFEDGDEVTELDSRTFRVDAPPTSDAGSTSGTNAED